MTLLTDLTQLVQLLLLSICNIIRTLFIEIYSILYQKTYTTESDACMSDKAKLDIYLIIQTVHGTCNDKDVRNIEEFSDLGLYFFTRSIASVRSLHGTG